MKHPCLASVVLIGTIFLLGTSSVELSAQPVPAETEPPVSSIPTFLFLADKSGQLTADELLERRHAIVRYLIENRYIYSGEDLVPTAAEAEQIIRAVLAPEGGFELTLYPRDSRMHREVSFDPDGYPEYICYPGDPDYNGDGVSPFYLFIAPLYPPHHDSHWRRDDHDHDHDRDHRHDGDHDGRRPPGGSHPEGNRDHPWSGNPGVQGERDPHPDHPGDHANGNKDPRTPPPNHEPAGGNNPHPPLPNSGPPVDHNHAGQPPAPNGKPGGDQNHRPPPTAPMPAGNPPLPVPHTSPPAFPPVPQSQPKNAPTLPVDPQGNRGGGPRTAPPTQLPPVHPRNDLSPPLPHPTPPPAGKPAPEPASSRSAPPSKKDGSA